MKCVGVLAALVAAAPESDAVYERLDALYRQRDDAKAIEEADRLIREQLKQRPDDYGLLWRASRHHVWTAETASNASRRKLDARLAWDFGDRARKVDSERVEGQVYAAAGVGVYGDAHGVMKAISEGVAGKLNERLDRAIALDPMFHRGLPLMMRARYLYMVPWPMRDLDESTKLLEKVLKSHPENLRARLYLADTLLADGEPKKAKEQIDAVLEGDERYDPPDARRVKAQAKESKKRIDEALD